MLTFISVLMESTRVLYRKFTTIANAVIVPISIGFIFIAFEPNIYSFLKIDVLYDESIYRIIFSSIIPIFVLLIIWGVVGVSIHRLVVLGNKSIPNKWGIFISIREFKYMFWCLVLYLPSSVLNFLLYAFAPAIFSNIFLEYISFFEKIISSIFLALMLGIFGIVLPMTAVEKSSGMVKSIRVSKGYRFTIFMSFLCITLSLWIINYFVSYLFGLTGLVRVTAFNLFANFILMFLYIFEIIILSIIYREIREKSGLSI